MTFMVCHDDSTPLSRLRYSLSIRRQPRSLAGLLRLWWHDFVVHPLFEGGERCQDCGRAYEIWRAQDALYCAVIGSRGGLFCPRCFARRAVESRKPMRWLHLALPVLLAPKTQAPVMADHKEGEQ